MNADPPPPHQYSFLAPDFGAFFRLQEINMTEDFDRFHLHIDKSGGNWIYSLRLRNAPEKIGSQLATFNPYATLHRPGLMERVVAVLNKELGKEL